MSEARETHVQPDGALSGAQELSAAGQRLAAKWADLSGKIKALNDARPWGDDKAGNEFNKEYLAGEAPAALTLQAGTDLMPVFRNLGGDVIQAVKGTVDYDGLISKWFKTE